MDVKESEKLKSVATKANEAMRGTLDLLKDIYFGDVEGEVLKTRIEKNRDKLRESIKSLDIWGCHP